MENVTSTLRAILAAASLATLFAASAFAADKPNFIVIFTDDRTCQGPGCYGSPDIKTPHLDQMAKEGLKFTSLADRSRGPERMVARRTKQADEGCHPELLNP